MPSTSMQVRPQVGQEMISTKSLRSPQARRMLRPAGTSCTGSPEMDTRMVSPMPSISSVPMPTAHFTTPTSAVPDSVTPMCWG